MIFRKKYSKMFYNLRATSEHYFKVDEILKFSYFAKNYYKNSWIVNALYYKIFKNFSVESTLRRERK